jgi:hypothetical protein
MPKVPTELNRKKREQRGRKKGPNLTGDIWHDFDFEELLVRFLFWFGFDFGFWDRDSLYSLDWLQTLDPPASASQVLGLQAYTTMPNLSVGFYCVCLFFVFAVLGYEPNRVLKVALENILGWSKLHEPELEKNIWENATDWVWLERNVRKCFPPSRYLTCTYLRSQQAYHCPPLL